jgi:hypothetical protein
MFWSKITTAMSKKIPMGTSISVISSDDLVNWTDHGVIEAAGTQGAAKRQVQNGQTIYSGISCEI